MRSLLLIFCCGCAAQNVEAPPAREHTVEETHLEAPSPAPVARPSGVIARSDLVAVLDQSPGAFLQHVDVTPRFSGGRFQGWRIVRFFPGDERFAGLDLTAGDVVLLVNGRAVEKPDQLIEVWQSLRTATALEVSLERNGEPKTLRWPIQ